MFVLNHSSDKVVQQRGGGEKKLKIPITTTTITLICSIEWFVGAFAGV